MQITLNQAEIETAIKKYVNDQVVIREDQDITIDLKAGRGPEGFTANIEIVPAGSVKPSPEVTSTASSKPLGIAKAVSKPTTPTSAPTPAAPEPVAKTASDTLSETAQEAAGEAPDQAATEGADDGQGDAGEAQGQEEAAPPSGDKPKSLFANLGKPRN